MSAQNPSTLSLLLPAALGTLILSGSSFGADMAATLQADAARIDADIVQLQLDQQKLHSLVDPDKKAVAAAQKTLDTDSAPLLEKLKADEQQFDSTLKAERNAIKNASDQGHAAIKAMETKLEQDRQRAARDKSVAAQIPQQEAQLKAARDKLRGDLHPLEEKLKTDAQAAKQSLDAERQAMALTLKPDTDALKTARQQLQSDLLWETKVAADQATLDADRQKLDQDKKAAGQ